MRLLEANISADVFTSEYQAFYFYFRHLFAMLIRHSRLYFVSVRGFAGSTFGQRHFKTRYQVELKDNGRLVDQEGNLIQVHLISRLRRNDFRTESVECRNFLGKLNRFKKDQSFCSAFSERSEERKRLLLSTSPTPDAGLRSSCAGESSGAEALKSVLDSIKRATRTRISGKAS